jgi:UPF0716 protein FxsA
VFGRLLILFIAVPMIELVLLLKVGSKIGLFPTIVVIVVTGIIGASLTRWQGTQTLAKYQEALSQGRIPHQELIDGLLILVAGAVLLTPGFLTDAAGFLLLIPGVRQLIRNRLSRTIMEKVGDQSNARNSTPPSSDASGKTRADNTLDIEAEIIDPDNRQ